MNIKTERIALFAALLFAFALSAAGAQDAVTKAVTSGNNHLLVRENEKAYSYASFVIRYYSGKQMPVDALDMCERSVAAWSQDLKAAERWDDLVALGQSLSAAPSSVSAKASESITLAKKKIEEKRVADQKAEEERKLVEAENRRQAEIAEALRLEKEKEAQREAEREAERKAYAEKEAKLQAERETLAREQKAEIDRILEESRAAESKKEEARAAERLASQNLQLELDRQQRESEAKFRDEMARMIEFNSDTGKDAYQTVAKTSMAVVIGFGILAFFVIMGIALIVFMNLRQQAIQHEQFQNTMSAMANLREANAPTMALPFMTQALQSLPQPQTLMIGQNAAGASGPAAAGGNSVMNTPDEIKNLHDTCARYSDQIDQVTNRKNASKRVAELVYKISKARGFSEHDALLFYTVGLVYDIGFLNIDPMLLRAERITEEQFAVIKTHTSIGMNMVFFVDEKNRKLFKDGVSLHHENLDGTGYPNGFKDADIPYIARVLRIAETYIALVSNRDYKDIKDRDSAIAELMSQSNHYDADIVKNLDEIV